MDVLEFLQATFPDKRQIILIPSSNGDNSSLDSYSFERQDLQFLNNVYCFPPLPIIGMVLKYLEQQKIDCVLILPATNEPWVNLVSAYIVDLEVVSKPFCAKAFTVLNNSGKKVSKKYPFSMIAVKLSFKNTSSILQHLLWLFCSFQILDGYQSPTTTVDRSRLRGLGIYSENVIDDVPFQAKYSLGRFYGAAFLLLNNIEDWFIL